MKRKFLSITIAVLVIVLLTPVTVLAADVNITGHTAGSLETEINSYMSGHGISTYSAITVLNVSGGTFNHVDRDFLYTTQMHQTLITVDLSNTSIDLTEANPPSKASSPNEIPPYTFGNWGALTSVKLPNTATSMKNWIFSMCTSLETVYLPSDLTNIEFENFHYSSKLKDIYTDSVAPPNPITDNTFNGVAEGAILHVPDGAGSAWDGKDSDSDGKVYQMRIENMAPIITHTETRSSDSAAEITLNSSEAGSCYYAAVKDGVAPPAIDTSGVGLTFDSSDRLTISLTGLETGAYDIYYKAKDLLNNVSELGKIDLEGYVPPLDVVINNHTSGNLEAEIDADLISLGFPDKYEKIQSLKVSGGALDITDWGVFGVHWEMGYSVQSIDLSKTTAQSIPDETFEFYCITDISLPAGLESIGDYAFCECGSLADITISSPTPPAVGTDAFFGVAPNAAVHVPAGSKTAYRAVNDGNTTDNLWYGLVFEAPQTGGKGGSSGGGGTPSYSADLSGAGSMGIKLPITINTAANSASVEVGTQLENILKNKETAIIDIPAIPEVDTYTLKIPAAYLSASVGDGSFIMATDTGSMTLPLDMLGSIAGLGGKKAEITIGKGDKSGMPDEVKEAIGDRPLVQLTLTLDGKQTDWNNPGAPVTVSIPYTPTAEELADPEGIVIWYIDGSGNPACVPNGQYNPATGAVTFSTTHFSHYAIGYNPISFKDVNNKAWYRDAVHFIAARGITTGKGDSSYDSDANLTRGEFLVMLMRTYGIAPDADPKENFADAGTAYYTGYLAEAKRLGISDGIGGNLFAPGNKITRQETATLLYKALKVLGEQQESTAVRNLSAYSDSGEIAKWAKDAMMQMVETGIINGSNGKLSPAGMATRAEMAQVLYNLLSK